MFTERLSLIWFPLATPGGQVTIFAEQFGAGEFQLKVAPAGVEVSVTFSDVPEQMSVVAGGFTDAVAMIVTVLEDSGPDPHSALIPETLITLGPGVALNGKDIDTVGTVVVTLP